jgi:hypothetical protein
MKRPTEEQTKQRETETAVWDQNWLQAERELAEISERDEAEAAVSRYTSNRQARDVHRVTVRSERRQECKTASAVK